MRVSVVIPTYNYAQFVTEAIDSVLAQSVPVHEIIVVDDGSTDDTRSQVAAYEDRVRYIFQRNQGLSAARNTGLSAAQGDAFALLDSDDAFHPRKLEFQIAALHANPEVVLIGTGLFSDPGARWPKVESPRLTEIPLTQFVTQTRFCPSSALFRRELWEQVGEFDRSLSGSADRDYWIRSAVLGRVCRLEAPLTFYRKHPAAMSGNAELMIAHERAVLDKAFAMSELRNRSWLMRRAYGMAALSAANMRLHDARRPRLAANAYLHSFVHWPLPFSRSDTIYSFYRLRLGLRLARELLSSQK